jgi:3-oxoacyl-[acyl-carrier protein] reductase
VKDKVVAITGASKGIGAELARQLAAKGARLVLAARNEAELDAVAKACRALGAAVVNVKADVSLERDCQAIVAGAVLAFGRLDVLVNNAGIMTRGAFADVPQKDYDSMWAINVHGTFLCTQYALRPMIAAKYGRIVNLSSQLARMSVGTGGFAAYAATKGAIEAFTRAMAHEVGQHGITVNAIAPGGIDTDMSKAVMTPEYRERRLKELPVRHLGEVADVAYCTVFLATAEANYLTGQVLQPNGGWVMA